MYPIVKFDTRRKYFRLCVKINSEVNLNQNCQKRSGVFLVSKKHKNSFFDKIPSTMECIRLFNAEVISKKSLTQKS